MKRKHHKTEYRQWSSEEEKVLCTSYPTHNNKDLSIMLGRSIQSIQRKASAMDLHKTKGCIAETKSSFRGERSPNWRGGRSTTRKGYIAIRPNNPITSSDKERIFEHRAVMEKHLGRKLAPNEVVHHINGDKTDNRLENLELMTRGEHSTLHNIGRIYSEESRRKMSESAKRRCATK